MGRVYTSNQNNDYYLIIIIKKWLIIITEAYHATKFRILVVGEYENDIWLLRGAWQRQQ
jgi:uncharacterized membrane protein